MDIAYGPNGVAVRLEAKASKCSAVEDPPPLVTAPSRTAPTELELAVARVCESTPLTYSWRVPGFGPPLPTACQTTSIVLTAVPPLMLNQVALVLVVPSWICTCGVPALSR